MGIVRLVCHIVSLRKVGLYSFLVYHKGRYDTHIWHDKRASSPPIIQRRNRFGFVPGAASHRRGWRTRLEAVPGNSSPPPSETRTPVKPMRALCEISSNGATPMRSGRSSISSPSMWVGTSNGLAMMHRTVVAWRPKPSSQHLAAIRNLFDWLVVGGILPSNPAAPVRGPRHSQVKGKTPVLLADDARALIRSIDVTGLPGLRDRAIIGVMVYSFARVSAALAMNRKDVFPMHHRLWLRLTEKGGKHHEMPCHHNLEEYLREYLDASGIEEGPLFRTLRGRTGQLNETRLQRSEALPHGQAPLPRRRA